MKINGRKLQLDGFVLYNDAEFIKIDNVDVSKKYKILYNGELYNADLLNNSIMFFIPNILENNILSINVYDYNGNYLYSTNSVEMMVCKKNFINVDFSRENKKNEERINKIEKELLEDKKEYNNDKKKTISKTDKISSQIENLEQKIQEQYNYISEIKNSLNSILESNKNTNYESDEIFETLDTKINEIVSEISLIKNNSSNEDVKNELKDNISKINTIISDLKDEIKNDDLEIKIKENSNKISSLKQDIEEVQNYIKDIDNKVEKIDLKGFFDTQDSKIQKILTKIYSLNQDIKTAKSFALEIQKSIENNKNILLPINQRNIESFCFVTMCDNQLIKYSYLKNQVPIGITDDRGNVVLKGICKVKYVGEINVGNFVYGNKNGLAENHSFGFIVTNIIDNEFCEVLL